MSQRVFLLSIARPYGCGEYELVKVFSSNPSPQEIMNEYKISHSDYDAEELIPYVDYKVTGMNVIDN